MAQLLYTKEPYFSLKIDEPTYPKIMKTVFLFISLFFAAMAMTSCTNDEGDGDIDVITPSDEDESIQPIGDITEN